MGVIRCPSGLSCVPLAWTGLIHVGQSDIGNKTVEIASQQWFKKNLKRDLSTTGLQWLSPFHTKPLRGHYEKNLKPFHMRM